MCWRQILPVHVILWLIFVPPPRTCASSFFNFTGNSTFYILIKDALKNTEGKTFLPCLSTALEVFKYLLVEILLSLSLYLPYSSLSLSLPTSMTRGLTFTAVGLTVLIALVLVHPTCCAFIAHLWETRHYKTRGFRLRFFGPRFKKHGPKLPKAPFSKNGA